MKPSHHLISALGLVCLSAASRADNLALVIGIDEYKQRDRINALTAASADAKALTKALQEVIGIKPDNLRTLSSDTALTPTRQNIIFELSQLAERAKPDDVVYLFYSGHGVEIDGKTYFLPYDTDARNDLTMKNSMLSTADFVEPLKHLNVRALVMVFDMCRTAPPKEGKNGVSTDNPLKPQMARDLSLHPYPMGGGPRMIVSLYACSPNQRSWEWLEKKRGYFSYYFEEGLRRAAADSEGIVRLPALIDYVEKNVTATVKTVEGKIQTPYADIKGTGVWDLKMAKVNPLQVVAINTESKAEPVAEKKAESIVITADNNSSSVSDYDRALQEGFRLAGQKKAAAAVVKFEEAATLNPSSGRAYFEIARIERTAYGNTERAGTYFAKAIEREPTNASYLNSYAILCQESGRYLEAESLYRKAMAAAPGDAAIAANYETFKRSKRQQAPPPAPEQNGNSELVQPDNSNYRGIIYNQPPLKDQATLFMEALDRHRQHMNYAGSLFQPTYFTSVRVVDLNGGNRGFVSQNQGRSGINTRPNTNPTIGNPRTGDPRSRQQSPAPPTSPRRGDERR